MLFFLGALRVKSFLPLLKYLELLCFVFYSKISRAALLYILKGLGFGLSAVKPLEQAKILPELVIPTEPPPEFEFIADPPSISSFDL